MDREIIEAVKEQVIKEAAQMRIINRKIPVTGERINLPLGDRIVNIVYYRAMEKNAPLLLGFHGGGFLFGGNAMNDAMWAAVRDILKMNVASVEYRKSPEYQYQEAVDDAYDTALYMKKHWKSFGFNPDKISVMGCSAGANLATALCIYAKPKKELTFEYQILMYPFLDSFTDPDSKGKGSLEGPIMHVFNELHSSPEDARKSVVSPVFAEEAELRELPHAVLCMADNDNLKSEGYKYAAMLKKAGVKTDVYQCQGMPHGFFESGFGSISEEEMQFLGEDVKEMIRNGSIAKASRDAIAFVARNVLEKINP